MKTTTTSCRSNGNPSNPHHGEPWWQSPTHRRQAKIIDRTLQVCGHMELFQPERDRRREKFGKTERPCDRAANVARNKTIRRAHRAAERNQWGVLAFMMREHEWLQGTLFPAAVQTAVSDRPHPKPKLPAASPHYSKKAKGRPALSVRHPHRRTDTHPHGGTDGGIQPHHGASQPAVGGWQDAGIQQSRRQAQAGHARRTPYPVT
jgi:hypothetical protein